MPLWEKLLIGAGLLMMFIFLIPRAKQMMEQSRQAQEKHWLTTAVLAGVLILFVLFLISSVGNQGSPY